MIQQENPGSFCYKKNLTLKLLQAIRLAVIKLRRIFPLRPIQILDTAFILSKKSFIKLFLLSFAFILPFQIIAWSIEVTAANASNDISGRTSLLAAIFQCFIVGAALVFTSNVFASKVSKIYCKEYIGKEYPAVFKIDRLKIFLIQFSYQIIILVACILTRFFLGKLFANSTANKLSAFLLILFVGIWSWLTLRKSFAIQISVNEQIVGKDLKARTKILNKYSSGTLLGTFSYCWLLVIILAIPMLGSLNYLISKDFIHGQIGQLAMLNIIFSFIVSFICVIYSFILVINYFNARVEHEGFDIALSINEIEQEGSTRGKLLNINKG